MQAGNERVHGIVLAGAHAWGASILERACPRPLLPVAGRPLIWFALDWLRQGGVQQVTICANSDTPALRACLADGESVGVALDYYEDVMPRGPAGCARDAAYRTQADLFVVVEGTILPQMDLPAILEAHRRLRAAFTLTATGQPAGDESDVLQPTGVYVASRPALELVPHKGYQDIKEMWIPRLYQQGCPAVPYRVGAECSLRVHGVGTYITATARAIGALKRQGRLDGGYRRCGEAWVHRTADVAGTARLSGDVLIGPGVIIENAAAVLGPTVLGPDCYLESSAVASHVIAWSDARIGRGAILNRCLLMNGSQVEAGRVVRDTIWCGKHLSAPWSGDRSSYWALQSPEETEAAPAREEAQWEWEEPVPSVAHS